ncbi:Tetratricopeptide TPR_1 repeat-containing protein [Runella slithyformis DSM 19594]|uniref:Tetratricopeptide TPR_1 repeat-containing protein n=1 Tax=Runella slithyformis (strain ATCC 29530 / DSM 19594 / LMG 11500 / NCIMB 11436 / LSU 4) TaxID=761193 RepID=A0A7U3ZJR1_RUNSL|nr:Tetratricopeptide TPR_1 repeat-containing protein [Runella slithyformis DSM 19594]
MNSGQYVKAIESYLKAIKFKHDFHEAYYNMGVAYANLGQYENAIKSCQNAIDIKSDYHEAYNNMGVSYANLGQKGQALQCYLKSQALGGDAYNLACWYAVEGQKTEALRWLRQALDKQQISLTHLAQDADWDGLREDAEFKALVANY